MLNGDRTSDILIFIRIITKLVNKVDVAPRFMYTEEKTSATVRIKMSIVLENYACEVITQLGLLPRAPVSITILPVTSLPTTIVILFWLQLITQTSNGNEFVSE